MAILRVKDANGNVHAIPAIKGDKGDRGSAGVGAHVGTYVGDGTFEQQILFDGDVSAVLIINQQCDIGVANNGFSIRGAMLMCEDTLSDGTYELASLTNPVSGMSVLTVRSATYNVGTETEYTNGFNEYGTVYRYIAFVSGEESA